MQTKDDAMPMWFIRGSLLFMAGGLGAMIYMAIPLPESKLIGGFLLTIGVIDVLWHKRFGSGYFAMTQFSWLLGARFWAQVGERGAQLLHLKIGLILGTGGIILLLLGQS
jgi:hypothetical protein